MGEIVNVEGSEIHSSVTTYSSGLQRYLETFGLPVANILVPDEQRMRVLQTFPMVIAGLEPRHRTDAHYLAKYLAACGAGLFDAALNFLWNEVVRNLRDKVARFDLDYFYDSVVTDPKRRKDFRNEEDLKDLSDMELIRGCRETGILSDIGYQHLDYIRSMRNHASAAHPNHNDLTGLQLVTWLETCIREVLAREPEGPVLRVRRFLTSVRTEVMGPIDAKSVLETLGTLPNEISGSLLRAYFGLYTDPDVDVQVRTNLKLLVAGIWRHAPQAAKQEMGVKYATLAVNGEVTRKNYAQEFLTICEGLGYIPEPHLSAMMDEPLDALQRAHFGWDNFHNEPAHAKILLSHVPADGKIPASLRHKYVKTITLCRIGNGYGVSRGAVSFYTTMISYLQEEEIWHFFALVYDEDVRSRLRLKECATTFQAVAAQLQLMATNPHLEQGLSLIVLSGDPNCTPQVQGDRPRVLNLLRAEKVGGEKHEGAPSQKGRPFVF